MISFPNAKINLGLNITSKRSDGYHNLETCFYPVQWNDILEILPSEQLQFNSSGIAIPGDGKDNLCLRAYQLLRDDFDIPPVQMHLHKIIPIGAGLGGGSADASFTLKALNDIFELKISDDKLEDYAAKLGSDCPFFIRNKPVMAKGTGNEFSPIGLDLSGKFILLIKPDIHVSTAEAYAGITPREPQKHIADMLMEPIESWKGFLINDFEKGIFKLHPAIAEMKDSLYDDGAIYACMSGSGSSVFGIYDQEPALPNGFSSFQHWIGQL
ncbi:MAG: 4-(cytidine 5'-diphospho)-2-C-methyl-D-erythritol kinase [Bacteroidota bacterium]